MVSGSNALLYFHSFHRGMQGSGPDMGRSTVEWGDFLFIRPSVCPSVRLSLRPPIRPSVSLSIRPSIPLGHSASPKARPARPEA